MIEFQWSNQVVALMLIAMGAGMGGIGFVLGFTEGRKHKDDKAVR